MYHNINDGEKEASSLNPKGVCPVIDKLQDVFVQEELLATITYHIIALNVSVN